MTEQHHEKSCNINNIVAKYTKTGLIEHINRYEPTWGDVTGADYQAAMETVKRAETEFHDLPAPLRAELNNDPAEYLDLLATDEGLEKLYALVNPEPAPEDAVEGLKQTPDAKTDQKEAPAEDPAVT